MAEVHPSSVATRAEEQSSVATKIEHQSSVSTTEQQRPRFITRMEDYSALVQQFPEEIKMTTVVDSSQLYKDEHIEVRLLTCTDGRSFFHRISFETELGTMSKGVPSLPTPIYHPEVIDDRLFRAFLEHRASSTIGPYNKVCDDIEKMMADARPSGVDQGNTDARYNYLKEKSILLTKIEDKLHNIGAHDTRGFHPPENDSYPLPELVPASLDVIINKELIEFDGMPELVPASSIETGELDEFDDMPDLVPSPTTERRTLDELIDEVDGGK